ncbi:hypothetical protein [Amycolatopsis sp. PS_44_ISF1]|uniref:hypothetical protein n=1 Tax=Amycolatopsis sp. PS_44_ISF1 TaxID=2974917 RepID=UPI0028DFE760|nr:hypothetical protein [Amycolatopsis sp. PS_44_ISF1]MDT8915805.1 hypothetical protein [Amycolatopsis sp. PS_44_ISF1]
MPTSRLSVGLFTVAGALVLAACGGTDTAAPAAPSPAPSVTQQDAGLDPAQCADPSFLNEHKAFCVNNPPTVSGPATAPLTLPGDIQVRVVSATSKPADPKIYDSDPTENTLVTITTEISNRGNTTFAFPPEGSSVRAELLYGADQYKATSWAVQEGGAADLPRQLVAGSSAKMTAKFTARKDGLNIAAFHFNPNSAATADATFNEIQTLFK